MAGNRSKNNVHQNFYNSLAIGLALGAGIGVALGAGVGVALGHIALGAAFGTSIGAAFGGGGGFMATFSGRRTVRSCGDDDE